MLLFVYLFPACFAHSPVGSERFYELLRVLLEVQGRICLEEGHFPVKIFNVLNTQGVIKDKKKKLSCLQDFLIKLLIPVQTIQIPCHNN